ncbi:MAG TPA: MaoC family dehydratase N-terminal domain-containing protein [Caulobacteraceae bacterium]|nr:MaoC family dehydratase N-terminal domain-containing protein [Caulobacteraceae bacterium]
MTGTLALHPADIEAWRGHVGRSEVRRQRLDVETARRFAAAIGADLDVEHRTPPLAHWAFFLEVVGPGDIGPDGHPRRGLGIMPNVSLPRRMFASAAMRFAEPLALGREAELTLTVADVKHRTGKTGELVFVEVDRVLTQDGRERLAERQTIVYRGAGEATPAVGPADLPARPGEEIWRPNPVDLFRFSAVTFNSHRIHYDQAYVREEEGYPDLVVHGPFTAVKLAMLAARDCPDKSMKSFSFRAMAPLFVDQPVRLAPGAAAGEVEAIRCDGAVAMAAGAVFA